MVGMLGLFLVPGVSAIRHPDHPYRYSLEDMPVSLAVGTVRTSEFSPPTHWYWILLQVEKPLASQHQQMRCRLGVTLGPLDLKDCSSNDPLVQADWKVVNEGHIVSSGSSTTETGGKFTNQYIFKFLGSFPAEAGKKYVLEVTFTKDGAVLNAANPHLIIVKQGEE
jgi:hypothetical protein